MTVVYKFDQFDFDSSNDIFTFIVNSSTTFTDIKINADVKILDEIENLAINNGQPIINSNTSYLFEFDGFAHLCGTCNINAMIGWQLWDLGFNMKISESYLIYSSFPMFGYYKPVSIDLPIFEHNNTGEFFLSYGMFYSVGSPNNDMVNENNINHEMIIINYYLDLAIIDMYPSHNPISPEYYFAGGGLGGTYIVELKELGLFFLICISILIGILFSKFTKHITHNHLIKFLSYSILLHVFIMIRGETFPNMWNLLKLIFFYYSLKFLIYPLKKNYVKYIINKKSNK